MGIQKTTQQFKNEVFERVGVEYSVLGEYTKSKQTISMRHNICGFEWMARPNKFLLKSKPSRCPNCKNTRIGHSLRRTHQEFLDAVYEEVGLEYTVLSEYINSQSKVTFQHNVCGKTWNVTPASFLNTKTRCPECANVASAKKQRKTHQSFCQELFDKVGNDYTVIGKYVNSKTKIEIKHNKCGHIWAVAPFSLLSHNSRCPKCFGHDKKTDRWFKNEVFVQVGVEYSVLGKYVNARSKVEMRHNTCGHTWFVLPRKFVGNERTRCPKCFKPPKKTDEQFRHEVFEQVGVEYTVVGNYVSNLVKVKLRHNICGHTWSIFPSNFMGKANQNRCPHCKQSKGEKKVEQCLLKWRLDYQSQYKFDDCKYKRKLPFDFAVLSRDRVLALIEYDGIQHDIPLDIFEGKDGFAIRKIRDDIKTEYCKKKNIPLIRINHTEYGSVEEILHLELTRLGLLSRNYLQTVA